MSDACKLLVALSFAIAMSVATAAIAPNPEFGYPAGFLPDCPGVLKNASISRKSMKYLKISTHRLTSTGIARQSMPIEAAHKMVERDKMIDLKNKKTLLYVTAYTETVVSLGTQPIGTAYSKRGYNVFITDTIAFFSYIYPKSVRLVPIVAQKIAEFLDRLTHQGLSPENLEIIGISLGAQVAAYVAKSFYSLTGQKPSRLTGLDPAGPCFRYLDSDHKLWRTDAERVEVVHTNIDGLGTAEMLGHIDIYINGGEYQPNDIPLIPCLMGCSHIKAAIYWWQALEHPKKFVASKCDSVQSARLGNCTSDSDNNNYLGLEAKFDRPGIYYLPTSNVFPYYVGEEGLKANYNVYTSVIESLNNEDVFEV